MKRKQEDHQILQVKFTAMNEEMKIDFEVRKGNFENAIDVKEKLIVSQRKTIEEDDEKLIGLYGKGKRNTLQSTSKTKTRGHVSYETKRKW